MKIESSKTTPAEKRIAANGKSETNFRSLFNSPEKLDSQPTGGFAKVLEETGNQNGKDKASHFEQETDCSPQKTETADAKKDEATDRNIPNREKVEEKKSDGDRQQSDQQDENSAFAFVNLQTALKPSSGTTIPAARSILHIADLERIVSLIRTQNLKNIEQVVIALKHSVLEGLQIKLTIDEQGSLKAEFLALNEQIKNHLNARKQEITQIFRKRGVKLSDLNIQQGSEFSHSTNHSEENPLSGENFAREKDVPATNETDFTNQTSYRV